MLGSTSECLKSGADQLFWDRLPKETTCLALTSGGPQNRAGRRSATEYLRVAVNQNRFSQPFECGSSRCRRHSPSRECCQECFQDLRKPRTLSKTPVASYIPIWPGNKIILAKVEATGTGFALTKLRVFQPFQAGLLTSWFSRLKLLLVTSGRGPGFNLTGIASENV